MIIADDHPIIMDALVQLLESDPDFELVGRCADGREALATVQSMQPDIALLDLRMPELSGLDVLREIHREKLRTKVILLTAEIADEEILDALRLGVGGIVLKATAAKNLMHAIRTVAIGGQAVHESTIRSALDSMIHREAGAVETARLLTSREIEIVRMVATGLRNRAISEKLSISESTVKVHVHSIYRKLGIATRVELSNYAREKRLI